MSMLRYAASGSDATSSSNIASIVILQSRQMLSVHEKRMVATILDIFCVFFNCQSRDLLHGLFFTDEKLKL